MFAILQKYEFSSKSQPAVSRNSAVWRCLRYCKSTSFQANHNIVINKQHNRHVVCDTAKVRVFKQITTEFVRKCTQRQLFAILQKYEFSSKSQPLCAFSQYPCCCLRYCKSTSFQANHNSHHATSLCAELFAILQKYEFSSKSQLSSDSRLLPICCLRYCKSTSFQANHNDILVGILKYLVVCDTAKVRVFKQITTVCRPVSYLSCCLRYCKCTSFQANHNKESARKAQGEVVCDTAKVRVFKQITTGNP